MTKLYSWRTDQWLPRVQDGGGKAGGLEETFVVREQFYI